MIIIMIVSVYILQSSTVGLCSRRPRVLLPAGGHHDSPAHPPTHHQQHHMWEKTISITQGFIRPPRFWLFSTSLKILYQKIAPFPKILIKVLYNDYYLIVVAIFRYAWVAAEADGVDSVQWCCWWGKPGVECEAGQPASRGQAKAGAHRQHYFKVWDQQLLLLCSQKIWRFGGLYHDRQIKIRQNFLLAYTMYMNRQI